MVSDAVESGWISSLGHYIVDFERVIAERCAAAHAVAVSNGTAALHLALRIAGVSAGDEVIVPSLTFAATAAAVSYLGAVPIFVDSDPDDWDMSLENVDRRITERTRAIVPVHLYGAPADMEGLLALAHRNNLALVEDAAEALGTTVGGQPVGALGTCGILSFYGNKLITTGEGGMIVTQDAELAARARLLRDHAMDPRRRYWHEEIGYNYRMTNMQAALGMAQNERFEAFLNRKHEISAAYAGGLSSVPGIQFQSVRTGARSADWAPTILIGTEIGIPRDDLADLLAGDGIDTRPAFQPCHRMPPYATGDDLPVADRIGDHGLTLPNSVTLTSEDQAYVVERLLSHLSPGVRGRG